LLLLFASIKYHFSYIFHLIQEINNQTVLYQFIKWFILGQGNLTFNWWSFIFRQSELKYFNILFVPNGSYDSLSNYTISFYYISIHISDYLVEVFGSKNYMVMIRKSAWITEVPWPNQKTHKSDVFIALHDLKVCAWGIIIYD